MADKEKLEEIIQEIRAILWLNSKGDGWFVDPEKEWTSSTASAIAGVLIDSNYGPELGHPLEIKEKKL